MAGPAFVPVAVKSETDTHFVLEGPAVVYGGADLTGEYMDANTDFWFKSLGTSKPALYDHGFNTEVKDSIIGSATLDSRDDGVWFTAEIDKSQRYAKQIQRLAEAKVLGASTGAVSHLVKREELDDGRVYLKSWPIAELSLTVTPAEPRTLDVKQIKALLAHAEFLKSVLPNDDSQDAVAALKAAEHSKHATTTHHVKAASFEDIRDRISVLINCNDDNPFICEPDWTWVVDTYDDHVIVCREDEDNDGDGGYWQIPYSVAEDGTVTLGDPVQVEQTYTPVTKSAPDIHITEATSPTPPSGEDDMALDQATQDALVEGVAAKFAPQFDAISKLLERFDNEPALKNAGHVTVDGGLADKNIKSFADYLMSVKRDDVKRLTEHYNVKAALAEDGGTTGGYLVPTEYVSRLLQVAAEDSIVRPRAYIQPMVARELEIPALDQQTAPTAGNTSFYGGVQAVWTAEGGGYTEKDATFKLIRLVAHKLAGYTLASNELQADSAVALEALLTRLFGGAIGWYEDYAFLRGDGVGKPLGVQYAPCTISQNRASGGNDFDPADIGAMLKQLLPTSARNAVWVMHPYLLPSLLSLSVGGAGFQTWVNNLRDSAPMTLLGLPVLFSEKMNTAGSSFDVLLADFRYYVVGDRQSINIASSEHYRFLNGQTTWRFEERVDGQPWLKSAITLSDASSTVSPFVLLN